MALTYLVTGKEGQVVRSIIERAADRPDIAIVTFGRPEVDFGAPETLGAAIAAIRPDIIISAAAYTAVDQAETEEDLATKVNGEAPGALARAAAGLDIPIVHISTDYVFDGTKTGAYVETDPVAPIGAYGRSKLAGEKAVASATPNHAILRTAWVHSPYGKNFVKTMLRLAVDRDELNVVADQVGCPTSALDIADAVLKVADNLLKSKDAALRGTFHLTNAGQANWAEFATEIFRLSAERDGPSATVNPIPSSAYPTPAKRPANSQLDGTKLSSIHGVVLQDWRPATEIVVARILEA
ncbi:dTDP-4-dehydrorhamnose reductase [Rhizobium sp. Leaf384]|nr:dTDP-4-dehydrorhamnose reductase [Rhizobium sp. Leaf383]KQS77893.1 dTDP-4-dehydrorhamnose reductase [Rhizobium sp. Leaf384]